MCGIIGAISENGGVAQDIYPGLWSLQHRGKESAGIITYDGQKYHKKKDMGTVEVVFGNDALLGLAGGAGIGHVRYSTTGPNSAENIQPVEGSFRSIPFWIGHNGNFTNTEELRAECESKGYYFKTTTDTEVLAALIFLHGLGGQKSFEYALKLSLKKIEGTYSIVVLYKNTVSGVVDPTANRPLVYGEGRGLRVLASESAACDVLGIKYLRDVGPCELIILQTTPTYLQRDHIGDHADDSSLKQKFCIFEYVYFLRPDSKFDGRRAQSTREEMGKRLWKESPVSADIVVPIPDSGNFAASGLATEAGLPFVMAFFRSHYVGRTFIEPIQERREKGLRIKLNIIPELVAGKRVVIVDDSIVRSTVIKKVIAMLREAGAKEIHVRISSPSYTHPCHYGIDTYRVKNELIAKRHGGNSEAIREEIGADSLHHLSLEGLKESVWVSRDKTVSRFGKEQMCDACFSGTYHIPIKERK